MNDIMTEKTQRRDDLRAIVDQGHLLVRPGPGWTKSGRAPVWDHVDGIRVHVSGLARLPGGMEINGMQGPEMYNLWRCVRICGGSRKRGAMLWALRAMESKGE